MLYCFQMYNSLRNQPIILGDLPFMQDSCEHLPLGLRYIISHPNPHQFAGKDLERWMTLSSLHGYVA